jgi:hypothetical protein
MRCSVIASTRQGDSIELKRGQCRPPKNQESNDAFRSRAIKRQRIQCGIRAAFLVSECRRRDDRDEQKADNKDYDPVSCVA